MAMRWTGRHIKACPPKLAKASEGGTPDSQFPGGHRGRVPPVPIPNTEVKPATADGTACAGVWESRSLPGLFLRRESPLQFEAGFFTYAPCLPRRSSAGGELGGACRRSCFTRSVTKDIESGSSSSTSVFTVRIADSEENSFDDIAQTSRRVRSNAPSEAGEHGRPEFPGRPQA